MNPCFIALRKLLQERVKMNYRSLPSFERDFKKLSKRYGTLGDDFETLKKYSIEIFHQGIVKMDDPVEISGACGDTFKSYKVKKFACKSLKGGSRSGLRVIYVHEPAENKITFVEIYYKGDTENEDKARLKEFISKLKG